LRQEQTIASNQEAAVEITSNDDELISLVDDFGIDGFAGLCIVSEVKLQKGPAAKITAVKSSCQKCNRCWNYRPGVGEDSEYDDLCRRCARVVKELRDNTT